MKVPWFSETEKFWGPEGREDSISRGKKEERGEGRKNKKETRKKCIKDRDGKYCKIIFKKFTGILNKKSPLPTIRQIRNYFYLI